RHKHSKQQAFHLYLLQKVAAQCIIVLLPAIGKWCLSPVTPASSFSPRMTICHAVLTPGHSEAYTGRGMADRVTSPAMQRAGEGRCRCASLWTTAEQHR